MQTTKNSPVSDAATTFWESLTDVERARADRRALALGLSGGRDLILVAA